MRDVVIGIDLGTTGARAIAYGGNFHELAQEYFEYPILRLPGGRVEQDAGLWWSLSAKAVRCALEKGGIKPERVKAVAVSSQGISVVPVDENFLPMANAISWLDGRARPQMARILEKCGASRLYEITGKLPMATYTLPKLVWLKENEPEVFASCHKILLPGDYIAARMTGRAATDHTMASGTMAYDLKKRAWSGEMLEIAGIGAEIEGKLPEIVWAGEEIGTLTKAAALEMGLEEGVSVRMGGQDQKCAALSAGLSEGVLTLSIGTAAAITMKCERMPEKETGFGLFNFFKPGETVLEGVAPTAGMSLRWLRDTFFPGKSYDELGEMALSARGSCGEIFLPHLAGEGSPGWLEDARGGFHDLSLETTPGGMVCAVMEGVAFEIARNIEEMEKTGGKAGEIRAFGGGAKSAVWLQIIADCTGKRVAMAAVTEAACLGAAMLAAGKRVLGTAACGRVFEPDPAFFAHYRRKYARYISICER